MTTTFLILILLFAVALGIYFTVRGGDRKGESKIEGERESCKKSCECSDEKAEKILAFLDGREDGEKKVTNNDVEKLLGVSDATATRYLSKLEGEGKIRQIGTTGQSVYYVLNTAQHSHKKPERLTP